MPNLVTTEELDESVAAYNKWVDKGGAGITEEQWLADDFGNDWELDLEEF